MASRSVPSSDRKPRARPPMRRGLKHTSASPSVISALAARAAPYEKGTETFVRVIGLVELNRRARGPL